VEDAMNAYLACFDIQDDRIRKRVGDLLLQYGERVQKSVFEISLRRPEDLGPLRREIQSLLEDGDDVRFYRLCAACRRSSQDAHGGRIAFLPSGIVI
jgi:CRISPR-associated protein Cas2